MKLVPFLPVLALAGAAAAVAGPAQHVVVILRDGARTWNIGYCRSVVRSDGRVVTVYYDATAEHHESHIAATFWTP